MAYTDIDDPSAYFQTKIYTGNGSTQDITFDGNSNLQPDFLWLKGRSLAEGHTLQNSVSGVTKHLHSQNADAEVTDTGIVTAFNSNGFSLGDEGDVNGNTSTFVGWGWKKVAGVFDIQTYTGNGSNRTIAHNLGVVPQMMIIKKISASGGNWQVNTAQLGANQNIELDDLSNGLATDNSYFNNTRPTSSVFSLGTDGNQNTDGVGYLGYFFGNKQGVSKVGSYTGNGNADGNFIYLGFKPAFILLKGTANTENWSMYDNKRTGFNVDNNVLAPNDSAAELTDDNIDLLSNGFKIRRQTGLLNDAQNYIYMAFAESPFVTSTGVPATAR